MRTIAECGPVFADSSFAAALLRRKAASADTLRSAEWPAGAWLPCVIALALMLSGCGRSNDKPQSLPKTAITIAGRTLAVEVASTDAQREMGMMYRRSLAPDEGMLFVFPKERRLGFYMKNTYVPLSIAYIAANGRIVNIVHMEPLTKKDHPSRLPVKYALEMPLGWFEKNKVRDGDTVGIPETVQAVNGD